MTTFLAKRIYEPAAESDGYRVLVDRLWPRGVSKQKADLNDWAKDLAPSTELRKWFAHDSARFADFSKKYVHELQQNPEFNKHVDDWKRHPTVTLLYGARDEKDNEAVVLQRNLQKHE